MIALTKHKKIMRTSNSGSDASNPRKSRTSSAASLAQVKQIFRGKREHVLWRQGLQISSFISQNLKPRTSKNTCRCSAYSTQPQTHILLLHHHLRPTSCSSIHVSPAECTRHTIYKHMQKQKHIFYQDMYSHICIPLFRSIMVYLQPSFLSLFFINWYWPNSWHTKNICTKMLTKSVASCGSSSWLWWAWNQKNMEKW